MDTVTKGELRELAKKRGMPCVSLYMPTHGPASEGAQDALRLKNLLRQAEVQMTNDGIRRPTAERMLEPARELIGDRVFWEKRSAGLAMFLSEDTFQWYRVPVSPVETAIVNRRFQLKQLLPLISGNHEFYLLALSQNKPRLFEGDQHALHELSVGGMPANIAEALNYTSVDRGSQTHAGARGSLGKQSSVFHGQGGERDTAKEDLANYFRLIDAAVLPIAQKRHLPLVLAGVHYLLPIYRDVTGYATLSACELVGNHDHESPQQLHDRVWPMLRAEFAQTREAAAAKFRQLAGTGKASDDVSQIVPAAWQGKVETLFIDPSAQQWGSFDPQTGSVVTSTTPQDGDDDLLDLAAIETLLNRGTVYADFGGHMPAPQIAAVFRY
jgi:hypothetical protein